MDDTPAEIMAVLILVPESVNGTMTSGSPVILVGVGDTMGLVVGMGVSGLGIPDNSVVISFVPDTSITMNASATQNISDKINFTSDVFFTDSLNDPLQPFPVYVSETPDGTNVPDNLGVVYDTAGMLLNRLMASGKNLNAYGLQIKVRSLDYKAGYARLSNLAEFLAKVRHQTVATDLNNYVVDSINQTSPVLSIGQDSQRRALFTLNVTMMLLE